MASVVGSPALPYPPTAAVSVGSNAAGAVRRSRASVPLVDALSVTSITGSGRKPYRGDCHTPMLDSSHRKKARKEVMKVWNIYTDIMCDECEVRPAYEDNWQCEECLAL